MNMTNVMRPQKPQKIDLMENQEEIEVPIKKQNPLEKMICEVHSTPSKKEEVKYINLSFIAKKKPDFCRTFLCDICYKEYRRKYPSNEDLQKVKAIKRFQQKYIESVFEKYSDDKPFAETSNLLEKAQMRLCSQIDILNQNFNQYCQIYKKNVKEMFQTLRKPVDTTQVRLFMEGKYNEGMVENFFNNYKTVNKYNVLIGSRNKEVLEGFFKGFKSSMEKISLETRTSMNASFDVSKLYIEKYDDYEKTPDNEKMVAESEQKGPKVSEDSARVNRNPKVQAPANSLTSFFVQAQRPVLKASETRREAPKISIKINKKREDLSSDSSDDSSQSDSDSSSSENEKRRVQKVSKKVQQKGEKVVRRAKHIQKQKRQRPYRKQNVHMIDEQFMKESRNRLAIYIVIKAEETRVGSERVFRMDIEEFKKKYPHAYNRYLSQREARR